MYTIKNMVFAIIAGGRSSARETASRVVAGAIAKQFLKDIRINAFVSAVGDIKLETPYQALDFKHIEENPVRCPDPKKAEEMEAYIRQIRKEGDTVGGIISCVIQNVPVGWENQPLINFMQNWEKQCYRSMQ